MKPTKEMIDTAGKILAGKDLEDCLIDLFDKQQTYVGDQDGWDAIRLEIYTKLAEIVLNAAFADHFCEDFVLPEPPAPPPKSKSFEYKPYGNYFIEYHTI